MGGGCTNQNPGLRHLAVEKKFVHAGAPRPASTGQRVGITLHWAAVAAVLPFADGRLQPAVGSPRSPQHAPHPL